ncbi:MAG TPA: HEAT repeat domain-containing protein [Planctomycetota bacterium]|nr:HEAT repeat domain-containing protein [Planctomycetota bacterium]
MRGRLARRLTWVLLALVLSHGRALHAQDDVSVWIERLGSEATRDQARDRLRELGPRAVGPLIRALRHRNAVIRSEAAFVLGRVGRGSAVEPLVAALADKDAEVRRKAAYALGEIADVRALDGLVAVLADDDAGVRANGCFALGQIGSPKSARALLGCLTDIDEGVRNHAANALGFSREPRVLPALAWTAVDDKSTGVRALAVTSMGRLGDAAACGILVDLLDDDEYLVRARAIESLLLLTHQRRGYDPRPARPSQRAAAVTAWENWYQQNRRKLGAVTPQPPRELHDAWDGKPPDKPGPDPAQLPPLPVDVLGEPQIFPDERLEITAPRTEEPKDPAPTDEQRATFTGALGHFEAGRFAEAARGFTDCTDALPGWKDACFDLALAERRAGRLDEAAAAYRRAQQLDPRDLEVYNNLGCVLDLLGRSTEAETFFRLGLTLEPKAPVLRYNLAGLLYREGKPVAARRDYEELLKSETLPAGIDASLVKVRLAACLVAWNERDGSAALATETAEKSESARVLREAGRVLFRLRRYVEALALFERAHKLAGDDPENAYVLAMFHLRTPVKEGGDPEKAAFYVELSVTGAPKEARYVAAAAETAWVRGDRKRAVELMEDAVRLAPTSKPLRARYEEYRKGAATSPAP